MDRKIAARILACGVVVVAALTLVVRGGALHPTANAFTFVALGLVFVVALRSATRATKLMLLVGTLGALGLFVGALLVQGFGSWNPGACGGACLEKEAADAYVADGIFGAAKMMFVLAAISAAVLVVRAARWRRDATDATLPAARVV